MPKQIEVRPYSGDSVCETKCGANAKWSMNQVPSGKTHLICRECAVHCFRDLKNTHNFMFFLSDKTAVYIMKESVNE